MRTILISGLSFTALAIASSGANALDLTAAGIADGFSLSEFVSGLGVASFGVGPLGMAVNSDGNVIVNDLWADSIMSSRMSTGRRSPPPSAARRTRDFRRRLCFSNGSVWGSTGFSPAGGNPGGALVKLNNDGTVNTVYANIPVTNGLWTNPVNGHLLGAGGSGIIDIDVSGAIPTFRVVTGTGSDGVSVSPDGKTVYNTGVTGFDIATGAMVYGSFGVSGADGMGVISGGALNGDIVVNSNNGFVALLDALGNQTIIADNGSRGDYTSPDRTNGSLLLTQSDSIWRLSVQGGRIGGGPTLASRSHPHGR